MDGERQRAAIVGALRADRNGLDTNQLAAALLLHPNTVRWHLGRLTDEGLVTSAPERRRPRGRPSVVYRLTPEGSAVGRDEYRLLATMLTAVVADDVRGEERAYATGVRWGRHLQAAEDAGDVAQLLDEQGFAAEQHGDTIEMRRCPFYALAETSPQVVCTLHQGIIDGALAASGVPACVARLDAFVEPGLCIARLKPVA
ncbi:MAG TPA: hypothetical protein VFJ78_05645 [Gaiellaceae bacterium]|nr:hypothetical protein [Gaiellaceae bacterium]